MSPPAEVEGLLEGARAVARKELRGGTRGIGIPLLVSSFAVLLYLLLLGASGVALTNEGAPWKVGAGLFLATGTLAGILAGLALPLLASLSLVGEKEKRTWELLRQTPLTPGGIVLGKASGTLAMTLLLLFVALPILAASWILGGVAPGRFLIAWGNLGLSLFFLAAWGMNFSADAKSQGRAVAMTVGSILLLGVLSLPLVVMGIFGQSASFPFAHALYIHPVVAFTRAGVAEAVIAGHRVPEWILADVFLLLGSALLLSTASAKLLRRENDRSPLKRLLLLGTFLALAVAGLWHEMAQQEIFAAALFTPLAILYVLILAAPPLDDSERKGRFYLARPELDRATSLPLFLAILTAVVEVLVWNAPLPLGRRALVMGLGGIGFVAIGWWSIRVALEALLGPGVAKAVWFALVAFVAISSMVPGLPHSFQKRLNAEPNLAREAISAVNPAHLPITILRIEKETGFNSRGGGYLRIDVARRRTLIDGEAAAGACAGLALLVVGFGIWGFARWRNRMSSV